MRLSASAISQGFEAVPRRGVDAKAVRRSVVEKREEGLDEGPRTAILVPMALRALKRLRGWRNVPF